ncbi:hypothetical protein [Actinokineospora sp. NBRC 105648]|uniref:hypothetical protein n=1 Tax=Actinokineospora sp. NBRC 105648 TaxID=3032206 RepID=UPI0024A1A9C5|nr:hypothetical protein [Actinokineospora sp. NBRC 105648]GLZ39726.1 hypothetical protein Acsp05_33500 [Actinokineospora sp. NBRC 105648]
MDLVELVDQQVGTEGERLRWDAPGIRLAEGIGVPLSRLEPLVAAAFWHSMVSLAAVRLQLAAAGASSAVLDDVRTIVVPHADGRRYDLVVLDPGRTYGADPVVVETDPYPDLFLPLRGSGCAHDDPVPGPLRAIVDRFVSWGGQAEDAVAALRDFTFQRSYEVLVIPEPALEPTAATPAAVTGAGGRRGTVGVLATDARGATVLTTAAHVVDGTQHPSVNGHAVEVVDLNHVVDVATLSCPTTHPGTRAAHLCGPTHVPPAATPVHFDGARSGPVDTIVTGYDPAIVAGPHHAAVRVYTRPVTAAGDSGAALLDHDNRLLGFCSDRTVPGAAVEFSTWVWASQVFDIMDLHL